MGMECRYCEKWKEQCRKFEEHFYWGHVDVRRMHFSKFMTGDFSKCMVIPKKFIENFNGELLETVELKAPSGDIWHVELKKTNDGVVLDCGWKYFVEAYGIQENDTLVFKYDGCSSFLVLMFEQSGCEKPASHRLKKGDPMDNLCAIPSVKRARNDSSVSSYGHTEQEQPITSQHRNSRANRSAEKNQVRVRKNSRRIYRPKNPLIASRKKKAAREDERCIIKAIENPANEVSLDELCSANMYFVSRKARVSDAEKKKLLSFAKSIQTDKPSFVSIMVPCSIVKRFYMTIPIAFAMKHLPRTSNRVFLRVPDEQRLWQVHCLVQARSVGFTSGWKNFVRGNHLKIGDICLFELLETQKDILMAVHINRI
ncbi:B3 domain-containing protein Os12g0592300 isoform X1 [Dendrobium catenatum]|uniref:B3 domain-containing protein n=1 Tax=Dendrobium catenatum TaxID=906689 RepID=A0A2I0VGR5_9ASPA|nr:B3 domain-containing protein Os12g0592300 isoform X1 [Dendrobium catenatum]XP_020690486.1 B3 domain-containing protein Os12g0592300 isoform X1 [Dendrobium catenatum]PKU62585.1 B3 domain-containing protein [Dendrobium catenatum]